MKALAKTKRADAERASEHCLRECFECVITRRCVRTQWQQVDFFHADTLGKRQNGVMVFAQVTVGKVEAIRQRRRKLETIPWHVTDVVLVLQLVETPNPANARRKLFHFRVHEYGLCGFPDVHREWKVRTDAIPVPREWFKAWQGDEKAEQKASGSGASGKAG